MDPFIRSCPLYRHAHPKGSQVTPNPLVSPVVGLDLPLPPASNPSCSLTPDVHSNPPVSQLIPRPHGGPGSPKPPCCLPSPPPVPPLDIPPQVWCNPRLLFPHPAVSTRPCRCYPPPLKRCPFSVHSSQWASRPAIVPACPPATARGGAAPRLR